MALCPKPKTRSIIAHKRIVNLKHVNVIEMLTSKDGPRAFMEMKAAVSNGSLSIFLNSKLKNAMGSLGKFQSVVRCGVCLFVSWAVCLYGI